MDFAIICAGLLLFGLGMYVILDGFDLGVGILFPWAPTDDCRNVMMSSIAPVWDGNETWLIYGGGLLFAAFPFAYSIILSALYLPIMLLILALILRGVAFEFRLKAVKSRWLWDFSFTAGSILAAFSQGLILGATIHGIKVENLVFKGNFFDCITPFSLTSGMALVIGYGFLGATWLVMKTQGITREWAKHITKPLLFMVLLFLLLISINTPLEYPHIAKRWFSMPNFLYLCPVPLFVLILAYGVFWGLDKNKDAVPFRAAIGIFLLGLVGVVISIWPYMIMPNITIWEVSASVSSQKFVFWLLAFSLPIILGYTFFVYKIFRGKVTKEEAFY
ncbi:MAG: cytochrome d ubiquinol oxidase subunit II [Gammaproteobacteria bacterium 39-13]|nr:cytochrome d ubiquinol oxidase subunit II [Gammaproteobacteria bacterium]OJV95085.1 MAG: cytochrome d ubiquinol oxidase subunit II [Gammaproteobacteria bacterium 39-13]